MMDFTADFQPHLCPQELFSVIHGAAADAEADGAPVPFQTTFFPFWGSYLRSRVINNSSTASENSKVAELTQKFQRYMTN